MGKSLTFIAPKSSSVAFTLIELIVVIIIVGILAAVGISQYSLIVEKARTAEAKVRLGNMRDLVYQYWLEKGDISTITNADVGVDGSCHSTDFYAYAVWGPNANTAALAAIRCTSGGKTPNASRQYVFSMIDYANTGQASWRCYYTDDNSSCFGLSPSMAY